MCTREEGASAHTGVRRVRVSAVEQRETKIRRVSHGRTQGGHFWTRMVTEGHQEQKSNTTNRPKRQQKQPQQRNKKTQW